MMTCRQCAELLLDFLAGDLDAIAGFFQQAEVRNHFFPVQHGFVGAHFVSEMAGGSWNSRGGAEGRQESGGDQSTGSEKRGQTPAAEKAVCLLFSAAGSAQGRFQARHNSVHNAR